MMKMSEEKEGPVPQPGDGCKEVTRHAPDTR